jgi:regulator of sigma E protease
VNFINLLAILSLNIGVFNLLPLPALDGGRILFLLVSAIIRRPIPAKWEGIIHAVGLIFFLGFAVFVTGKDIWQLIF